MSNSSIWPIDKTQSVATTNKEEDIDAEWCYKKQYKMK